MSAEGRCYLREIMEILSQLWNLLGKSSDQIVALAVAFTALFAYLGLRTWRHELKGRSEYERAKQLLKAVYKVRNSFYQVRHIAIYQFEYPEQMRDHNGHLKKEHEYGGTAHVYETRWTVLNDAFRELEEQNLEAQVEWGDEFLDIIVPLRECKTDLQIALEDFLESKKTSRGYEGISMEERKEIRSKIYFYGKDSKHETFQPQIDAAIKKFEDRLSPIIRK